ncbi:MAG: long-chain fatty acid--CoA ligase [Spirochaetes bacterium]|nr:long-chain fatty acid--CoA ligase [Spirochaetota bacterium]
MNMKINITPRHLAMMINEKCDRQGDRPALFRREADGWHAITWREMGDMIHSVSLALLELGVRERECVAVYSHNRPEWAIVDYGIMNIGAVTVPIYATNTSPQAEYIIDDASVRVLFLDGQFQLDNALQFFRINRHLEKIIVFDRKLILNGGGDVMHFGEFLNLGKRSKRSDELVARQARFRGDDIATIIYTSGTTGDPKGAMLTHANFLSQITALDRRLPFSEDDIELCFLPLSHAYGKTSGYWVQSHGASVYYCEDPAKVIDYFREVRPTYMCGVPRLYEKIYAAVQEKLEQASSLKRGLFRWAVDVGREYHSRRLKGQALPLFLRLKQFAAERLVLKKIRALLGGRLNFFSAGGAPLAAEIEEFFLAANVFIAQGYGLTETAPMITCNYPGKFRFGTPGTAIVNSEIRIADDGEILVRGANVMKGYFRKPIQTREAFTEDGWFRTGDIGFVDAEGFLHITDRKKDIIITAQGKNIAPQGIESLLGQDFYIEQVAVIGDRRKYVSALVVPSFEALRAWARRNGIEHSGNEELVKDPRVIGLYRARIDALTGHLAQYEKIKRFALVPREFTQEKGEITPTMKIKRRILEEHFAEVIDALYAE